MNPKTLAIGAVIAVAVFAAAYLFYDTGTPHLVGEIERVSVIGMDREASAAIVQVRLTNPSPRDFTVRDRQMSIEDATGQVWMGRVFKARDLDRLYEYFPVLGRQTHETLIHQTVIEPGKSATVLLGARFEAPKHRLDARSSLTLRIATQNGPYSEIRQ